MDNNQTTREEFIVIAPFGSIGEPVVQPSDWMKKNRFQIEVRSVMAVSWQCHAGQMVCVLGERI